MSRVGSFARVRGGCDRLPVGFFRVGVRGEKINVSDCECGKDTKFRNYSSLELWGVASFELGSCKFRIEELLVSSWGVASLIVLRRRVTKLPATEKIIAYIKSTFFWK